MSKEKVVNLNDLRTQNSSFSLIRGMLAKALGFGFQGQRDLYTALGYTKELKFDNYMSKYSRQDIAKAVVEAPVLESWKDAPLVLEVNATRKQDEKGRPEPSDFEQKWRELAADKQLKLLHYLSRADILSGIGRYAILYLGLDGLSATEGPNKPATGNKKLLFVTPFSEANAKIKSYVSDQDNPRFGKPEMYEVTFANAEATGAGGGTSTMQVHWTRTIHISEGALESDIFGTPRLEAVFNRLDDLEKVVGGSGEAFWQQGFPGLHFDIRDDADIDDQTLPDLKEATEKYVHRLERVIRTQGVDVKTLTSQIADPSKLVAVYLDLISGTTQIPKRVLIGSERGELASTQDETRWAKKVTTRRTNHINPNILDQAILRLIEFGILPAPGAEGWTYIWPDLYGPSDSDRAETNKKRTDALVAYANAPQADRVVPLSIFLSEYQGLTEEQVAKTEAILDEEGKLLHDEDEEIDEGDVPPSQGAVDI